MTDTRRAKVDIVGEVISIELEGYTPAEVKDIVRDIRGVEDSSKVTHEEIHSTYQLSEGSVLIAKSDGAAGFSNIHAGDQVTVHSIDSTDGDIFINHEGDTALLVFNHEIDEFLLRKTH